MHASTRSVCVQLSVALSLAAGLVSCKYTGLSPTSPALASVTITVTSTAPGGSVPGQVTLDGPAPSGGASVTLASDNASVLSVTSPLTVPAGAVSQGFTANALTAGGAAITATYSGKSVKSQPVTVTTPVGPSQLATLSFDPSTTTGGTSSTGTVTLTTPAPPGGAVITLGSGDNIVTVPATVTVAAGTSSATFAATTKVVASTFAVKVTASYLGRSVTTDLSVKP
jgi:hypothetical protein